MLTNRAAHGKYESIAEMDADNGLIVASHSESQNDTFEKVELPTIIQLLISWEETQSWVGAPNSFPVLLSCHTNGFFLRYSRSAT